MSELEEVAGMVQKALPPSCAVSISKDYVLFRPTINGKIMRVIVLPEEQIRVRPGVRGSSRTKARLLQV